jgi:hypothetical protein
LIGEVFEGVRVTILQFVTVSGASVVLAVTLFYAGVAVAPSIGQWLRAKGLPNPSTNAEQAALRAGLARAMPLGIATVLALSFVPALFQPIFTADFPLASQLVVGLVINVIGDIFILISESVTKHLWPDDRSPR